MFFQDFKYLFLFQDDWAQAPAGAGDWGGESAGPTWS